MNLKERHLLKVRIINQQDGRFYQKGKTSFAQTLPNRVVSHGIEGSAVDSEGNIYACNFARQQTIGKVSRSGKVSVFVKLPDDSIACEVRFNSKGEMFITDYVNPNIFKIDMDTRKLSVFVYEPRMN